MKQHTRRLPIWAQPALLVAIATAGFLLRVSETVRTPFLLDGDPYLHALLAKFIVQTGQLPVSIPQQVPSAHLFYPLGSHAFLASLITTGLPLLPLFRWFGPVLSVLVGFALYVFTRRLTGSSWIALSAMLMSILMPFLTVRLSIGLPEHFFLLASLLCLTALVEWARSRGWPWLAVAILAVAGAFAVHFSGYFLLPPLIVGLLLGFIPDKVRLGPLLKGVGLGLVVIAAGAAVIYISYPQLYSTLRSFANTAAANPEFLPAPKLIDWRQNLNTAVLILAIPGALWLFRPRGGIGWRPLVVLATFALTILAFLQILPSLHIYNLLPFRAFTYFALPVALAAGTGLVVIARIWRIWGMLAAGLLLLFHAGFGPAGWDIDLIQPEVQAIQWLDGHTPANTLVYTQPIIGPQISLFSHDRVNYDLAYFLAPTQTKDIQARFAGFQQQVAASNAYLFISDYKLSPAYNRGFTRDGTLADVPLAKIAADTGVFHLVFKNNAVRIYSVNIAYE